MNNTVDKVLSIAKAEVGYLEKSKTAYKNNPGVLDEKTEGAGKDNYTKYGRDMHKIYPGVMDFPAAWCDCFVDWCFQKAYGVSNAKKLLAGQFNDYTVASAQLYKNKKAWHSKPKVGDQIFFRNSERICHTGLVYKVDDSSVYTIEGNTSSEDGVVANGGAVARKKYSLTNNRIAGYGRPKYDVAEKTEIKKEETPKTGGLNKTRKWTGKVSGCWSLNVRKQGNPDADKCTTFGPLRKNTEVDVCDSVKAPNGDKWYYIEYKGKYGFVNSKFIKKI